MYLNINQEIQTFIYIYIHVGYTFCFETSYHIRVMFSIHPSFQPGASVKKIPTLRGDAPRRLGRGTGPSQGAPVIPRVGPGDFRRFFFRGKKPPTRNYGSEGRIFLGGGIYVLLETNSQKNLKMDDWNTIVSFWNGLFSGANC